MKSLVAALGTLLITAVGFLFGAVSGFLLAVSLHLHSPGEVSDIGGMFNGVFAGVFYGLIFGVVSAIMAAFFAIRLFKSS